MYDADLANELIKSQVRDDTWLDIGHVRVGKTDLWVGRINYEDGSYDIVEGQGESVSQVIAQLNRARLGSIPKPSPERARDYRAKQEAMALQQQEEITRQRKEQKLLKEAQRHELDVKFDGDLFESREH